MGKLYIFRTNFATFRQTRTYNTLKNIKDSENTNLKQYYPKGTQYLAARKIINIYFGYVVNTRTYAS